MQRKYIKLFEERFSDDELELAGMGIDSDRVELWKFAKQVSAEILADYADAFDSPMTSVSRSEFSPDAIYDYLVDWADTNGLSAEEVIAEFDWRTLLHELGLVNLVHETLTDSESDELMGMGFSDKRKERAIRILQDFFQRLELPTELELVETSDDPEIGDYFLWDAFDGAIEPISISINDEGEVGFGWDATPLPVAAHTEDQVRDMITALNEHPISIDSITIDDIAKIWQDLDEEWGPGSVADELDEEAETSTPPSTSAVIKYTNPVSAEITKDESRGKQNVIKFKSGGTTRYYKIVGSVGFKDYDLNFKWIKKEPNGDLQFARYTSGGVDIETIPYNDMATVIKGMNSGSSDINPVTGIHFYKI